MLPDIKKILFATDLSSKSKYVLRYVANSAQRHDARIVVLYVFEQHEFQLISDAAKDQMASLMQKDQIPMLKKDVFDCYRNKIEHWINSLSTASAGNKSDLRRRIETIEITAGTLPEEILEQAERYHCDAIIMGTHSKASSGFANAMLGSTARRLLRRTSKPVFVIPVPQEYDCNEGW